MKLKTSARRAKLQKMYPEQYRVAVRTLKLMKTTIAVVGALWCAAALAQPAPTAAGRWQGKIQLPNHDLEITVDLDRNPKGAWIGSISVTGSTSIDVPLSAVTVQDSAVSFTAPLPGPASFKASLSGDGKTLSGTASNPNGEAPFELARSGEAKVKVPPPSSPLPKEFEGTWEGALQTNGQTLRIRMKMSAAADGTATAVLIALDQGNLEIPASTVTIAGKEIRIEVRAMSGAYHGTLAGAEIAGEWSQGPATLQLTFKRAAQ
jgi:hypothetical protein